MLQHSSLAMSCNIHYNSGFPVVVMCFRGKVFTGRWIETAVHLLLLVGTCFGAVAWQCFDPIRYVITNLASLYCNGTCVGG
jgi:hypothetical protein